MSSNIATLIDTYGERKAQIEALQAELDELRTSLIESGYDVVAGDKYVVEIGTHERTTVDYKTIVAKLEPSHQLLSAHTKVVPVTTVKVTDRRLLNGTKLNRKLKLAA